jgi:hypothetical protein
MRKTKITLDFFLTIAYTSYDEVNLLRNYFYPRIFPIENGPNELSSARVANWNSFILNEGNIFSTKCFREETSV